MSFKTSEITNYNEFKKRYKKFHGLKTIHIYNHIDILNNFMIMVTLYSHD